jgi:membrane dipeptidase
VRAADALTPEALRRWLGVSRDAIDLCRSSDVIDLHVDSFIWTRLFGYSLARRHGPGFFGGRFYSQVDLPRLREAGISGAIWAITTNPFRSSRRRAAAFVTNLARLRDTLERSPDTAVVRSASEYRRAREAGKHAAFIGIQGGNALDRDADALDLIPDDLVVKVTVVHLTPSSLGGTSSPLARLTPRRAGLSPAGSEFVRRLDAKRIFVDLAHSARQTFFDAVRVHDRSLPLLVSHTGVAGVQPHWRNVDDEQLRAVADTGGVVGVMYHQDFLGPAARGAAAIIDNLEHIVRTVGEDVPALGSDWDGMIVTPRDMPTCVELPRLVQMMLDRGWSEDRIRKVLGGNFLRALSALRG